MTLTKSSFERIYKSEQNAKVKERMRLIHSVVYGKRVSPHVAKDLHRNRSWASVWLKRYDEEGTDGLKDRAKCGRPTELSSEMEYKIKTILRESNQSWTTKQVEELIIQESRIKYHYTHIYCILRKWGFRRKVPRKAHVNTASKQEKEEFKKRPTRYLRWVHDAKRKRKSLG